MGFGRAIAAEQTIIKKQRYFINRIVGGDIKR
ncbi:hypothetical protein LTSEMIN_1580, partial [Salmonella enterica subsp. enterica serovar Minnesota str. A4-603]